MKRRPQKRLFIATDNALLCGVAAVNNYPKIKIVLNGFPKAGKLGCFQDNGFTPIADLESCSLFLIADSDPAAVLERIQIDKENDRDYLLYHLSRSKDDVIALFNPLCVRGGRHEKYDPKKGHEYHWFSYLVDVLLDSTIAAEQKAEKAIERIWPDREQKKKEGLKLLETYRKNAPQGKCPDVFAEVDEMKSAFQELKGEPGDEVYDAALIKLIEIFVSHVSNP